MPDGAEGGIYGFVHDLLNDQMAFWRAELEVATAAGDEAKIRRCREAIVCYEKKISDAVGDWLKGEII